MFSRQDVVKAFQKAHEDKIESFEIEFCVERRPPAKDQKKAEAEYNWFSPEEFNDEIVGSIGIEEIRDIAAIRHPDIDFSEEALPTEMIEMAIRAIRSDEITPEEHALGHFT